MKHRAALFGLSLGTKLAPRARNAISPAMSPTARRASAWVVALTLVLLGIFLSRQTPPPGQAGTDNPLTHLGAPANPPPPVPDSPPPHLGGTAAVPARGAIDGIRSAAPAGAMSLDEIHRVVAANSVPGRMVFLDFVLDRTGMRLVAATGAAGRAKPSGSRSGFGFVHYEVFGPAGDLLLSGSVEDPTRRRIEYPAATDDGRITSTVQFSDEGPLAVRIPGEIGAARIVFFRDKNPLAPGAPSRENLGEFPLRPQP